MFVKIYYYISKEAFLWDFFQWAPTSPKWFETLAESTLEIEWSLALLKQSTSLSNFISVEEPFPFFLFRDHFSLDLRRHELIVKCLLVARVHSWLKQIGIGAIVSGLRMFTSIAHSDTE